MDELERADELTEPLGIRRISWAPEVTNDEVTALQREDESIAPLIQWLENDYQPTPDELRSYSLETRNLSALRAQLQIQSGVLTRIL